MDHVYWMNRWQNEHIGFHKPVPHPLLVAHFDKLHLKAGDRVFLPLCGKTRDISFFMQKGCHVVGCELSSIAIEALFKELEVDPVITQLDDDMSRYSANNIDIFVGDFFRLTKTSIGKIDALYDRAAIIALPPDMQVLYAQQIQRLAPNVPQLIITYIYDQSKRNGPPFSTSLDQLNQYYSQNYSITEIEHLETARFKGEDLPATENIYLLTPKT